MLLYLVNFLRELEARCEVSGGRRECGTSVFSVASASASTFAAQTHPCRFQCTNGVGRGDDHRLHDHPHHFCTARSLSRTLVSSLRYKSSKKK